MISSETPIAKPTETEKLIWQHVRPVRGRGLIRDASFVYNDIVQWREWHRDPDPTEPKDYETKLLAGCRGEWYASVVDGRRRVLDVGCGFGFPSFYLARYDHEVVGVDVSESEIGMARRIAESLGDPPNVSFRVYDGATLPFGDGSFDAATFSTSLECMESPEGMMRELQRVLKPGSPVAIEEEDRSKGPRTHPVWEQCRWAFFDARIWLRHETRITDPDLDREYVLEIRGDGPLANQLRRTERTVLGRDGGLAQVPFEDVGVGLERALSEVVEAGYSETRGFTSVTLRELLLEAGLTDVRHQMQPDGQAFADCLRSQGLLSMMPTDVRGVLRALVRSVPAVTDPVSCMVSARTPNRNETTTTTVSCRTAS